MTAQNIESLRARVQALGFDLFKYEDPSEGLHQLYVVDPKTHELVFVHKSDDSGFDDWLAEHEGKTPEHANGSASLRHAAERVVAALQHARENHWPTVTLENDGGYADPERPPVLQLRDALDALETALNIEPDSTEVRSIKRNGKAGAQLAVVKSDKRDIARAFSEYAESELHNIKKIIGYIDHLAHDGQQGTDPAATLEVIERLAREAHGVMFGHFWDKLTDGLRRVNGGAA
jgi:hypothetical protein